MTCVNTILVEFNEIKNNKGHALCEMCHISMIKNFVYLTKENESQVLK
jgi:hypothetical protein